MAWLGLTWLDLRLAALPDTLFKFLLVSNQPQPAKPAGATPMHSTWDATHPPLPAHKHSSQLLQPVAVQTDSGLLPIRRAVGGAKYLPTAS